MGEGVVVVVVEEAACADLDVEEPHRVDSGRVGQLGDLMA